MKFLVSWRCAIQDFLALPQWDTVFELVYYEPANIHEREDTTFLQKFETIYLMKQCENLRSCMTQDYVVSHHRNHNVSYRNPQKYVGENKHSPFGYMFPP
jgi:hypothetical protein